jgi:hypothetical protein
MGSLFGSNMPAATPPAYPPTRDNTKEEADAAAKRYAESHTAKAKRSTILTSTQGLKEEEEKYPKKKLKKTFSA